MAVCTLGVSRAQTRMDESIPAEAILVPEAFTSALTEQSVLSTDKVRVEFEGDEVFWSLQDNYSFEMLLADASRYWDVAPQDAMLVDERGAIWPNDAYVGLELQRAPNAKITLKIKPVAVTVDEDIEMYGREGESAHAGAVEPHPAHIARGTQGWR